MNARKAMAGTGSRIAATAKKWMELLDHDAKLMVALQGMYYGVFTLCALMLIFVPWIFQAEYVAMTVGDISYDLWLWLMLGCPTLTLIGRRFTHIASTRGVGEANPGYAGAQLQFTGDAGVWSSINIYAYGLFETDWWKHHLYTSSFILMGVLGGFLFVARSMRRLITIRSRNRHVKKHGWG